MRVQFHSGRFGGWKSPVEPGDYFSLWTPDHEMVLQLDASVVLEMLAARVREAKIVRLIMESAGDPLAFERLSLRPAPPDVPAAPVLALPTPGQRAHLTKQQKRDAHRPLCGVATLSTGAPCNLRAPCRFHPQEGAQR